MSAVSELSERIKGHAERGEWERAMAALADAWRESGTAPGVRHCTHPEFPEAWVRFRGHGYPFRLRQDLDGARDDAVVLRIILPYVEDWNLTEVDGKPVDKPGGQAAPELLDNVDEALVVWLIGEFYRHRGEVISLRKNS